MSSFITSLLMPIYIFLGMASPIAVGTSVTTINGSDTLSASRTVINDNFTALNNGKIENSTTSLPLLTSASGLATVGTITSGTWNATAIAVNKGGTGTTSPTQYHIMAGGGSSGLSAISTGSAGMFLTSNGASAYPTFQSASVDQTQAYTWTGLHTYNTGGVINNASSTFTARVQIPANASNKLNLNGVDYAFPSTQGASSTIPVKDANGNIVFLSPAFYKSVASSSSELRTSADTEENTYSIIYEKKKEIKVWLSGTYTIKFDLRVSAGHGGGGETGYGQIYKNGSAIGTERTTTSETYATYSEDFTLVAGDLIQLYGKYSVNNYGVNLRNFRLYYTPITTTDFDTVTDS